MKKYKSRQNIELEDFLVFFAYLTGAKKLNKAHGITASLHRSTPDPFQVAKTFFSPLQTS